jgi:hypothetical protein
MGKNKKNKSKKPKAKPQKEENVIAKVVSEQKEQPKTVVEPAIVESVPTEVGKIDAKLAENEAFLAGLRDRLAKVTAESEKMEESAKIEVQTADKNLIEDEEAEINLLGSKPAPKKSTAPPSDTNKNLLVAQLYKIEADMIGENKKFQVQCQILKMKQSSLSQRVASEGMEHNLCVVKLERAILTLKQKNKEISAQLESKDYALSTQAYPGELKQKLNSELDKTMADMEECQKEYSAANDAYSGRIQSLTIEKQALINRHQQTNADHREKMDAFDARVKELRGDFNVAGIDGMSGKQAKEELRKEESKQAAKEAKGTSRGRRIPKGMQSTKTAALAQMKENQEM